jgi:hypothetical protein
VIGRSVLDEMRCTPIAEIELQGFPKTGLVTF